MTDMPDFGRNLDDDSDMAKLSEEGKKTIDDVEAYIKTAKELGLTPENDRGLRLLLEMQNLLGLVSKQTIMIAVRDHVLREALVDICQYGMTMTVDGEVRKDQVSRELLEIVMPALVKIQSLG